MAVATSPITRSGMTSQLSPETLAALPSAAAELSALMGRLESTASKAKDAATAIRADRGLSTSGVQERLVELTDNSADSLVQITRGAIAHTAEALRNNRASVRLDTPVRLNNLTEVSALGERKRRTLDELEMAQVERTQEHVIALAQSPKRQAELQGFAEEAASDELRMLALDQLAPYEREEIDRRLTGKKLDEIRREFRRSSAPPKTLANIAALGEVGIRLTANLGAAWSLIQKTVGIESALGTRQVRELQAILQDAQG